jgi:hypothetical protein
MEDLSNFDRDEFWDSKLWCLHWFIEVNRLSKVHFASLLCTEFQPWQLRRYEAKLINDTFFLLRLFFRVTWDPWTIIHTMSSDHETGGAGGAWKLLPGICLQIWAVSEHANPMTTILVSANCMRIWCIIVQVRELFQPVSRNRLSPRFINKAQRPNRYKVMRETFYNSQTDQR